MKIISTPETKTVGHYSPAIKLPNGFLFFSGQISDKEGSFSEETRGALLKLQKLVEEAGGTIGNIIKCTIFLTDISKFDEVNKVYAEFFGEHKPTRSTIGVASLPKGRKVEIEAIAWIP